MKKLILMMVFAALLVLSSCSDEKTKPKTTDSQALQGELTGSIEEVASAQGAVAMNKSMPVLDYLPFSMPISGLNKTFDKIERNSKAAQVSLLKNIIPTSDKITKQVEEDHLIFANHVGTYTLASIVWSTSTDTEGELVEYVSDAQFTSDLNNPNNKIIINLPKSVSGLENDIRYELNAYDDVAFFVEYDENQNPVYDYYPVEIDLDLFVNDTNVFALDMTADWEYMTAMDDVMPKFLNLTLGMTPFTLTIAYSQDVNVLSYSINLKKNSVTQMNFASQITFVDTTLEEVDQIAIQYSFGVYEIDFWADSELNSITESEEYTLDEQVTILNDGDYIWANIYENDVLIGALQAKIILDENEWNDETQEWGVYKVVPYIKFTDGSEIALDVYMDMLEGYTN